MKIKLWESQGEKQVQSTWSFGNQVPLSERLDVCFSLFFIIQKLCLEFII